MISPNDINPVDYFNRNYVQWTYDFMLKQKNINQTSINSFTYVQNKSDQTKHMVSIVDGHFVANMPNGLGLSHDEGVKYTPFQMLQKFKFKDKFTPALHFVIREIMLNKSEFIRVGVKYFKVISKVDQNGIKRKILKVWDRNVLIDDYGKDILDTVEKFDDFTMVPSNTDYQPLIGNNYNLYRPFTHKNNFY